MANNNVAILSIMSKFDEKSAKDAAKRAGKVYEDELQNLGDIKLDEKLSKNFNKAMDLLKGKFKKVNLSSYINKLLDSIFSNKDVKEKFADIDDFIKKINLLNKAASGQDINAFNTLSAKQIDALISRTEKLAQKQEEINEKTREYNREATKIAKSTRTASTIDKKYGSQDYSKTLDSLKKSLGIEKEFTKEQEESVNNLAKMVYLYQTMEKAEPQKGTAEAIRYSKDLLVVTQKIKEEREKVDSFTNKGATRFIDENELSSVNKVSDYTVNKSKEDFVKANLNTLKTQEAKIQSDLTTYIIDSVQRNLQKVTTEANSAVDKAEKRVEGLQNKIDTLKSSSKKNDDVQVIGNIVDETQLKSLEDIEDRLYEIYDKDSDGNATNKELKEFIQLYKQYEQLISKDDTVKFDPELKTEYEYILKSSDSLKKYSNQLDETIAKQKESSDINALNSDQNSTTTQLSKQKEEIKKTIEAEQDLSNIQKSNSNIAISVEAKQALEDINAVKESLENIPNEKNIKISVNNTDYSSVPLLSNEEGNVVTAFRGVTNAWSGLINQDGIGFFTDKLELAADYADSLAESGKVFQANLSFHNPLEIEGNGAKWNEIDFDGGKHTTDEIIQIAKDLGYDGVIFKNIRDGFSDTEEDISNVMVALNAAQIKNEQVVGAVKAGTGELTNVASNSNNISDNVTTSVVDSQNKIQNELQETQNQAEKTAQSISGIRSTPQELNAPSASTSAVEQQNKLQSELKETQAQAEETAQTIKEVSSTPQESNISSTSNQRKDVFSDSSTETKPETEGMEQVEKATDKAVQAKKDFATANEGVQSSIDGSENPLKLEAELMEQIAKSAREATDAKKEFVEANKQVKDSAEGSKSKNKKKDKYANIKKVSSDEFLDRYDEFLAVGNKVASQKGGTILGNSVNISYDIENELVNVSAKIKDVDGTWRSFSAKLSSDLQVFPTGFRTITKGINKLDNELANFGKDEVKTQETDEQIQKFKELNTAIDDYASVRKRIANGKAYDNDEENSQKLLKTINEIMGKADGSATILSSKQLSDAQDRLDKINKTISEIQQKNAQNDSNSLLKIQDNATKKLSSYTNASTYTPEFIERVESKITEIKQLKITDPKDVARLKEIDSEVQKIVDDSKLLENKLVKQESHLADIISQMKIYRSENTNMSSSQKKSLNSMISFAEELAHSGKVTAEQIEQIKIAFSGLKAEISETGRTGKNFFSQIRNRLTDINSKFIAQFLSWQDWIMYIRQAAEMVTELNTQIIGLAKVSEDSISKIYADFDSYANIAKEMGSTISDTIAATTAWSKNGYNIPDSKKLAEVSLLYKNVGDGINIDEANESLVSTLKGFKLEADQAEHIVDVFNEVSNNEAISSSGIGEALQRSAASFNAANTSLEKSVALVTATNSVIQDPDKVGNMWKTKFYCLYVQKCA